MQLNELLAQVDELKAEIDKLRPLKPEVEHRIMQKFRLDWNYNSNAIEGNKLTLGETKAFLMEGLTASGKPLKDHLDIKGHNELISFLELFIQGKERLTEAAIREMHKILLREPYEAEAVTVEGQIVKKWIKLGEYKLTPNFVRTSTGEIHQYSPPEDVAPKMAELVQWHREREEKSDLHPALQAALFHHRFLAIHPFDDGNGRLGRILLNLIVLRHGFPPVVVKLADRDSYVAALRKADVGESEGLATFVCQNLLDAESLYLRGAKGGSIEDVDDVDKAIALFKQELAHIDKTLPLSMQIQQECLRISIAPLLERIELKLQQFDELFAERSVVISLAIKNSDAADTKTIPTEASYPPAGWRKAFFARIETVNARTELIDSAAITFNWSRFNRAQLNAFNFKAGIKLSFQELNFSVLQNTEPSSDIHKLYPRQISREEIEIFTANLAADALLNIKKRLEPKNPKN